MHRRGRGIERPAGSVDSRRELSGDSLGSGAFVPAAEMVGAPEAGFEKGLGCQSGFSWRANYAERETQQRIRDRMEGEVRATYGTYLYRYGLAV